ncbi:hypothetical protein QE152_g4496 [Popillia japonica]|uniref:Reverse transcriptase domain-containing protein n=1 Tax=Popillia japonica TaxID=7064 RepID=A0AAW1N2G0_POPJA
MLVLREDGMGISAKGAHPLTTEWIKAMLESTTVGISGGCPQGRFLSPLLCCLVADALIGILTSHGYEMQGYGDDLLSMIKSYRNFKMKLITWSPETMQLQRERKEENAKRAKERGTTGSTYDL